jgi:hypothetical protein
MWIKPERRAPASLHSDWDFRIDCEVEREGSEKQMRIWLIVSIEPVNGPLGDLPRMDMRIQHRQPRKRNEGQMSRFGWDGWRHNREKQQVGGVGWPIDVEFRGGRFLAWSGTSRRGYRGVRDRVGHRGDGYVMVRMINTVLQSKHAKE